jgi:hypothetical protein
MKKPRRGFPPGALFVSFNFVNILIWGFVSTACGGSGGVVSSAALHVPAHTSVNGPGLLW